MSKFWSKVVHTLTPYIPGEQPKLNNLIKLNTNENPYGPSSKVINVIKQFSDDTLRLYPDPNSEALKKMIADYFKVNINNIFVGNGSDEVLAIAFQALLKHDRPILFPDITYSFYPAYCKLYEIDFKIIPLNESFEIALEGYLAPNGGVIFPNPNAPTGIPLPLNQIEKFLKKNNDSLLIVDEAYVDFGTESAVHLTQKYYNLLVTHSFSKSRALAGLRLGYAIGHQDLIEALIRVKDSFNSYPIDRLALVAGIESFKDDLYFKNICQKVIATKLKFVNELASLNFLVLPSGANFVFAKHLSKDGKLIVSELREHGIVVRRFDKPVRISSYIRFTIGSDDEMDTLLKTLKLILSA
ncbi:MAG: histidinol-phosphate transaminase [Candidatus Methylopumilus sp.]|nr:histidinol-phosphate transaminase [Candidatus Methylopumilus sp.]